MPVTDANIDTPSYLENAEGFGLSREGMIFFLDAYLPDAAKVDQYALPMLAEDLSICPRL